MKILTIQYTNYWNDPFNDRWLFHFIKETFKENYQVIEVKNKKDCDILIASVNGPLNKIDSYKAKLKLFFTGENLNRYSEYSNINTLKKYFDLIVGFSPTDLKNKIIRFPLWLMYYKFYKMTNDSNNIIDFIENKRISNKNKQKKYFTACVSRHSRLGVRKYICDKMSIFGKIIYPGSWRKNFSIGPTAIDKVEFLTDVKYNICPENSKAPLYHTEKIFHALEAGCVPIYWAVDLPEKDIINSRCYQFINIDNKNLVEKQIKEVIENYENYINEEVFLNGAKEVVSDYYNVLRDNIKNTI
uniref:Alpha-(1,3)-fucosyltransferase FucT N-terminal domain-containing protein n=1 Tax=viral metagenome TaxID=1070528 RepID=A0A6C0B687_9ZZZZ